MRQIDCEAAVIAWEWAVLKQKVKYKDTPPGLQDEAVIKSRTEELKAREESYKTGKIPVLQNVTEIPDEAFAGRAEELKRIGTAFEEKKGPVIICGIGGIGKTALARAYMRKFSGAYDSVLFLTCSGSVEQMITSDRQVAIRGMQYRKDKYGSRRRYYRAKTEALTDIFIRDKILVVIDDWNEVKDKDKETALSFPCDLIITTRTSPALWEKGTAFELKELQTPGEWKDFFSLLADDTSDYKLLEQFCRKVRGHTLLMKLFAAEIKMQADDKGISLQTGTQENKADSMLISDSLESIHDFIDRIPLKIGSKEILMMLSVMPAEGISRERFLTISQADEKALDMAEDCLLAEVSGENGEWLSMHPVIAEEVRMRYRPTAEKCRKLLRGTGNQLKRIWHSSQDVINSWEPIVFSMLRSFQEPPAFLAREFEILVTWLWLQEYYDEAETLMRKILKSVASFYGDGHILIGEMQLRLAAVYFNSGRLEEADTWYERAYETLQSKKTNDFRHLGQRSLAASKLSRVYRSRKEYDRALALINEAIRLFEQCIDPLKMAAKSAASGGEENIGTLPFTTYLTVSYYYLDKGKIYLRTGRTEEAGKMYSMAVQVLEKDDVAGDLAKNSFGASEYEKFRFGLLFAEKKWDEAIEQAHNMLSHALRFRTEEHPYVLEIREGLADALEASGRGEDAVCEYADVLAIYRSHHPYRKIDIQRINGKRFKTGQNDSHRP